MIIEPERSGKTISDVCIAFGVSGANNLDNAYILR
jgi:hypothetical protein